MTVISSSPSSVVSAGAWTNGTNVYTNNSVYATNTGATQNTEYPLDVGGFDFSTIPTGSTINSVTVTIEAKAANASRAQIKGELYDNTTLISGTLALTGLPTFDSNFTFTPAATLAQLKSANLKVRVINKRIASSGTTTSVDWVKVDVDYTEPPPLITQAAYGFYADGTQTGSTALTTQDTAPTVDLTGGDVNLGLRVRLQETGGNAAPATDDWQLQWEKNASGTWANVRLPGENPADQFTARATSNQFGKTGSNIALGQSFFGNGENLTKISFSLFRSSGAANVGTLSAELYAHDTGAFGSGATAARPVGTALATSTNTIDAQSGVGTVSTFYDFTFDGTFTLTNGTAYFAVIRASAGLGSATSDGVSLDLNASGTHEGSRANCTSAGVWSGFTGDYVFKVWTTNSVYGSTAVGFASASMTDIGATTNRLTGGSGAFVAGRVSETGVANDVGLSASNYTELLYSLTLIAADVANGDTLRFRVLRNGATTGMTYTQVPTVNVTVGATNYDGTASLGGTGAITESHSLGVGVTNYDGTATLNGAGSVTATGVAVVTYAGTASAAGVGSIVATGAVGKSSTATLSGAGSVAATGSAHRATTATLNGTGAITVSGVVARTQAATVAGIGAISASGAVGKSSTASVPGAGSLTATGVKGLQTTVTVAGVGSISPTGSSGALNYNGTASLSGAGAITATASSWLGAARPLFEYALDEGVGITSANTGTHPTGDVVLAGGSGDPTWEAGHTGTGVDVYPGWGGLNFTDVPTSVKQYPRSTLMGWIKTKGFPGSDSGNYIIHLTPFAYLAVQTSADAHISFVYHGAGGSELTFWPGLTVPWGVWTHVAASFDYATGQVKMYIDGALVASDTVTDQVLLPGNPSADNVVSLFPLYTATMDDARIFDTVLSDAEVAGWMNVSGGQDKSSTASLSGAGLITATGATAKTSTASLTGAGAFTVAGSRLLTSAASRTGVGTITVTDVTARSGTATLAGAGTIAATGGGTVAGNATLNGTGAITASGILGLATSATLGGSGSIASTGTVARFSTGTLGGFGTVTATGSTSRTSTASLTGSGAVSTTGQVVSGASAALTGTSAITAVSVVARTSTASLAGAGTISASSGTAAVSSASIAGGGSIAASGVTAKTGSATLNGVGSISPTGFSAAGPSSVLMGAGTITAAFTLGGTRSASVPGTGVIAATGVVNRSATATASGVGAITAAGVLGKSSTAVLAGTGTLTAVGAVAGGKPSTLSGTGLITATGVLGLRSTAALAGGGSISPIGVVSVTAAAVLLGIASILVAGDVPPDGGYPEVPQSRRLSGGLSHTLRGLATPHTLKGASEQHTLKGASEQHTLIGLSP